MKKQGNHLNVIAVILVAIGLGLFGVVLVASHHHPQPAVHKATCWQPSYAAHPAAAWAKHPSPAHRHGKGARGSNVCG